MFVPPVPSIPGIRHAQGPGAEAERRLGGGAADGEDAAGGGAEGPTKCREFQDGFMDKSNNNGFMERTV